VVLINMENVSADRLSKQLLQIVLQNGIPSTQQ